MQCTLEDLRDKNVVNIKDGVNFGCVDDIVIDTENAAVLSIVIYGKKRLFGLLGREPDLIIAWADIKVIGSDVILISVDNLKNACIANNNRKNFIKTFFR